MIRLISAAFLIVFPTASIPLLLVKNEYFTGVQFAFSFIIIAACLGAGCALLAGGSPKKPISK